MDYINYRWYDREKIVGAKMEINEIFINPTVKQVSFEVRFPNLFYVENRIGEFQSIIMKDFPESNLVIRRQLLFTDVGPNVKMEDIESKLEKDSSSVKLWEFTSQKGVKVIISSQTLVITSDHHKTYDMADGDKFRDVISLVTSAFFKVMQIPKATRVGLRYIDECPVIKKTKESFQSYYNSVFPLRRFDIEKADQMMFNGTFKSGKNYLRYVESLQKKDKKYVLILDFDGFTTDVIAENCLDVTDRLHKMISEEFEKTAREPLREYMRRKKNK